MSLISFQALAAEMAENFGKRLAPLGIIVRELTGDMSLTKTEIMQTQVNFSVVEDHHQIVFHQLVADVDNHPREVGRCDP